MSDVFYPELELEKVKKEIALLEVKIQKFKLLQSRHQGIVDMPKDKLDTFNELQREMPSITKRMDVCAELKSGLESFIRARDEGEPDSSSDEDYDDDDDSWIPCSTNVNEDPYGGLDIESVEWIKANLKDFNEKVSEQNQPSEAYKKAKARGELYRPISEDVTNELELHRLAKLGAYHEFRNFFGSQHCNLHAHLDNRGRTVLHYAADSGNVALIDYLMRQEGLSPLQPGVRGTMDSGGGLQDLCPLAIAIVLNHTEAVACMRRFIEENSDNLTSQPNAVPLDGLQNRGEIIQKYIPAPPGVVAMKPAVKPAKRMQGHTFWGRPMEDCPLDTGMHFSSVADPQLKLTEVAKVMSSSEGAQPNRFYAWLQPPSAKKLASFPRRSFVAHSVDMSAIALVAVFDGPTPIMLRREEEKLECVTEVPAFIGHIWLSKEHRQRHGGVLVNAVRHWLVKNRHEVAFFLSSAPGPEQIEIAPVARVRWYQRVLRPLHILQDGQWGAGPVAKEVYPDYSQFTSVLACDLFLKASIKGSQSPHLDWYHVNPCEPRGIEMIQAFLNEWLPRVSDLYINFGDQLPALLNVTSGFVAVNKEGTAVTDFVCFAIRRSRYPGQDGIKGTAAIMVFSLFTSLVKESRLNEMVRLSAQQECDVLYTSNTCDLSMAEHRLANFDEAKGYATNLFAVKPDFTSAVGPVTPSKIFLPFAMI